MNRYIYLLSIALMGSSILSVSLHAESISKRKIELTPTESNIDFSYANRADALNVSDAIATQHKLPKEWVRLLISQSKKISRVIQLMTPAPLGQQKNWRLYRERFVEPKRIAAGKRFWKDNQITLNKAEKIYGVPPEIIVAILGIETYYGKYMGNFRVLDSLATLAFDFPESHPRQKERSAYFLNELGYLFVLAKEKGVNPTTLEGSYAGAIGMPQFMPSSWINFAIDFDKDENIDLINSTEDIIGSVANYFQKFNWKRGMPTHYKITINSNQLQLVNLLEPDILPTFTADYFAKNGVQLPTQGKRHPGPLALVELKNGHDSPSFIAGTENFYAITRYNWSSYYAMAVIELAEAVAREMKNRP